MAKGFKAFDQKYRRFAGTALLQIESAGGKIAKEDLDIKEWPHKSLFREDYSIAEVSYAVYTAERAEQWQKFRVSLKGLNTREKLYALSWYWDTHVEAGAGAHLTAEQLRHEIIRVNNYLGALKRGGLIDHNLIVTH